MDEYDAPRKTPVEHQENCPNLKEIEEQTCLLFEEFLKLDDILLDAPLPASYSAKTEQSDSPVFLKSSLQSGTRGVSSKLEQKEVLESEDDDVVADSAPVSPPPPVAAAAAAQVTTPDDKMKVLAQELAKAGDKLVQEYGPDVEDVEGKLLQLVKQEASNLTYERFSLAVDDLVGRDKDWTNLVFAFCVGKRICKHSQEAITYTKSFFQRYIFQSYSQTLQESGGWEPLLRSHGAYSAPQ